VLAKLLLLVPILASFAFFTFLEGNFSSKLVTSGCFAESLNTQTLGQFDPAPDIAFFNGKEVVPLKTDLVARFDQNQNVLPAHLTPEGTEKWIEIDLSGQKLRAWEGNKQVMEYVISSGKQSTPTPPGEYRVWVKLRYTRMRGGIRGTSDYYDLPNVPYVMYFHKGYGIHGAYWHISFGRPVSHGCVNMRIADAGTLFNWTAPASNGKSVTYPSPENPGTRVLVH